MVSLLALLTGCVSDFSPRVGNADEAIITLNLSFPGGGVSSRSLAAEPDITGENRIDDIAVLAFSQQGTDWVYEYQAQIISQTQDDQHLTIQARVFGMTAAQEFVILANASSELAAAAPARKEKRSVIEERLVCSTGGGEWPAHNNGAEDFTPFPMYARTEGRVIDADLSVSTSLFRMVARIDVRLKAGIDNFELAEACLFNYKTAGYVSYGERLDGNAVTSLAVPAAGDHSGVPILEPTVRYAAANTGEGVDPRGEILSSIYTFETPAITSEAGKTTGTALVVGGYYDGSDELSYYRIDLKTIDDFSSDISSGLLRNHTYNVVIQEVAGGGSGTAKDAYLGGAKLSAKVMPWNNAAQSVIIDDQYFLRVSSFLGVNDITVSGMGGLGNLYIVETNYKPTDDRQGFPAGLQLDIIYTPKVDAEDEWITLTLTPAEEQLGYSDPALENLYILIIQADMNFTYAGRTAKIQVKAGNMTKIINVTQNDWVRFRFALSNVVYVEEDGVGKYTFAEDVEDLARIPANAQGLYFKWMSLVGVSGTGANGSEFNAAEHIPFKNFPGYGGDPALNNVTWSKIPYLWENALKPSDNPKSNVAAGTGDICQYISAQGWVKNEWRMANNYDYRDYLLNATKYELSVEGFKGYRIGNNPWDSQEQSLVNGMGQINNGWYYGADVKPSKIENISPTHLSVFFPASGGRDDTGKLWNPGTVGGYRTNANVITNSTFDMYLPFYTYLGYVWTRSEAIPVRCVRREE